MSQKLIVLTLITLISVSCGNSTSQTVPLAGAGGQVLMQEESEQATEVATEEATEEAEEKETVVVFDTEPPIFIALNATNKYVVIQKWGCNSGDIPISKLYVIGKLKTSWVDCVDLIRLEGNPSAKIILANPEVKLYPQEVKVYRGNPEGVVLEVEKVLP